MGFVRLYMLEVPQRGQIKTNEHEFGLKSDDLTNLSRKFWRNGLNNYKNPVLRELERKYDRPEVCEGGVSWSAVLRLYYSLIHECHPFSMRTYTNS